LKVIKGLQSEISQMPNLAPFALRQAQGLEQAKRAETAPFCGNSNFPF